MTQPNCFYIGDALVFPHQHRVQRDGQTTRIEPRLMALLMCLAEEPGAVVSRTDLLDATWPEGYGTDEGLTKAISGLRRAFGDSAREARVIETVPKRGYRLVTPVRAHAAEATAPEPAPERPAHTTSAPHARRMAPLWVTIAILAVALIGQWVYLARDASPLVERQARYHTPLNPPIQVWPTGPYSLRDNSFFGSTFFC